MVTIGVLLSQDGSEGGTAGIGVEIKLLIEVRLDETREGHQRALKFHEGRVMGWSPKVLNIRIAFSLAGQVI